MKTAIIQFIASTLMLDEEDIVGVYLVGSRLTGTSGSSSDYDLMVIVDSDQWRSDHVDLFMNCSFKVVFENEVVREESREGCFDVDFCVYHIDYWNFLMEEHEMYLIQCIWLPEEFCWKRYERDERFRVRSYKLKHSVVREILRVHSIGKRFISSGQAYKGKKKIVYSIRILLFALQILKNGKISDFQCANDYYYELMKERYDDWDSCQLFFSDLIKNWVAEIKDIVDIVHERRDTRYNLCTISFLEENRSVYDLEKLFSINVTEKNGLFYLHKINKEGDWDHIACECTPLVVHLNKDAWEVVALGHKKFFDTNSVESQNTIELSSSSIFKKYDGVQVVMFFSPVSNDWELTFYNTRISFTLSMILSEKIDNPSSLPDLSSLENVFWNIWQSSDYKIPDPTDNLCYLFELCTDSLRHICKYDEDIIIFHGARNITTTEYIDNGQELIHSVQYNWTRPEQFYFDESTLEELKKSLWKKAPYESCGYVIVDSHQNRAIISAPQYSSLKAVIELPRNVVVPQPHHFLFIARFQIHKEHFFLEEDLFVLNFPEWNDLYYAAKEMILGFCQQIEEVYEPLKNIETKREFANRVKKLKFKPLLFSLYNEKLTIFDLLGDINLLTQNQLEKHMNVDKTTERKYF